ncbi:MAG: hypothetical protein K2P49_08000 [Oscillospiraceae bacterium]|nr:hypothetical protein [Oscillospiraceae bacterium]
MKKRILTGVAALLCAVTLLTAGVAPALASPPPEVDEGGISARYDEVRWYFRTRDGVREMRLWSITRGVWVTDWVPVPDQ